MKPTTTTQVSVDGVVQGNGEPDENRSGGFERGGWARPLFDSEAMTFVDQVYQRAGAFLFGRPRLRPAQVSSDGFDGIVHNRRTRKSSKEIREAVSDRDRGVRSRGERPPTRGAPNQRR
jgi:hypothetical protein